MAKSLPNIDTNLDTFYSWIVKTNGLVTFCNTEVVSANNSANGAITTGKGYVIGTFGSNTLVTDTLRGGNTIANAVLTISSNAIFTDNVNRFNTGLTLGANSIVHHHGTRVLTSNTSVQPSDSFPVAGSRSAKYVISITDTVNSRYQATEIMLLHDGTQTYTTEYATLSSNVNLCVFTSDISGGNVRLLITPAVAPLQINISRTLVSV